MAHRGYNCDENTPIVFSWQLPAEPAVEAINDPFEDEHPRDAVYRLASRFERSKAGRIAKQVRYLHFIVPRTTGTEDKYAPSGYRDWYETRDPVYMALIAPIRAKAKAESDAFWSHERNIPLIADYQDRIELDAELDSLYAESDEYPDMESVVLDWINE